MHLQTIYPDQLAFRCKIRHRAVFAARSTPVYDNRQRDQNPKYHT